MNVVAIFFVIFIIALVLAFIDYKCSIVYCCKCKTKMNRDFIVEDDCEEYTCPECGHKFRIYG